MARLKPAPAPPPAAAKPPKPASAINLSALASSPQAAPAPSLAHRASISIAYRDGRTRAPPRELPAPPVNSLAEEVGARATLALFFW